MSWLKRLFAKIEAIFNSPAIEAVEKEVETLVPLALPIVQEIAALTPNKTVQEVAVAYEKFAVPLAREIGSDATSIGNALLNLATTVLQKNHAPAAAISLLNTVVQIALMGLKSATAAA